MSEENKGTSPWVYIGVGCLVSVFLIIAAIVAIGAWGFSQVRELQRTMEDPVARAEQAREMLATDELPDGYNAMMALSVPFIMETVVLTDLEPTDGGRPDRLGERGFIYFKTLSMGDQEQEMRDFFDGDAENPELLNQSSIRVDAREFIARGSIEEPGRTLRYVAYRGEINGQMQAGVEDALTTMVMFECPGAERVRMGIWFGPDPSPDTAANETDFSGTVADEGAIQDFMANFDVCSR